MRVIQQVQRKAYNTNPKGSATVEVTMAQGLPFDRPVTIVQAANVPIQNPSRKLWGPGMPAVSHSHAKRGWRQAMLPANVDGLGQTTGVQDPNAPAQPAMNPMDVFKSTALTVGQTLATAGAQKLAAKIAPKAPKASVLPQFIQNVPKTNWIIVGVAAVVAVGGIFMLTRKGAPARRRR